MLLAKLFAIYVRPILESNSQVWSPSLKFEINMLEDVQRTYTRIIYLKSLRTTPLSLPSYETRLSELGLPSLSLRRKSLDLCYLHKILKNTLVKNRFSYNFVLAPTDGRKSAFKVVIPFARKAGYQNSYYVRMSRCLTVLPKEFFICESVSQVKSFIRQHRNLIENLP